MEFRNPSFIARSKQKVLDWVESEEEPDFDLEMRIRPANSALFRGPVAE